MSKDTSKLFSLVKINDKDDKFVKLKQKLLTDLKENIVCEDYEPIISYVFEVITKPDVTMKVVESDFKELFEENGIYLLDALIKHIESTYTPSSSDIKKDIKELVTIRKNSKEQHFNNNNNTEKDLIDEFFEEKESKTKSQPNGKFNNNYNNQYNNNFNPDSQFKRGRPGFKEQFHIGGKMVVLKGSKHETNGDTSNSHYRERSREDEMKYPPQQFDFYGNNYYMGHMPHSQFSVPRGISKPGMRGGRMPMMTFPQRMPGMRPSFRPPRMPSISKQENQNKNENENKEENTNKDENENIDSDNRINKLENTNEPNNANNDTNNQENNENTDGEPKKKKVRCKKWPICKDDNCPYIHPTETCKFFPKCTFGDSCINIHPNIPCKFGVYCTRVNCAYTHSNIQPRMPMGGYYGGGVNYMRPKKPHMEGQGYHRQQQKQPQPEEYDNLEQENENIENNN